MVRAAEELYREGGGERGVAWKRRALDGRGRERTR